MDQSFTTTLKAQEIACVRGGRRLFEDLSFTLRPGDALVLQGPNGAGKTSLMRQIAGLLPLAGGEVLAMEAASDTCTETPLKELCHYVGHLNAIKTTLCVAENLAFWADFLGSPSGGVEAGLAAFGLTPLKEAPAGLLSAGQKRKLALARLLVSPRPIWLLDEPSVSLDQASVARLSSVLGNHRKAGGVAIVATHVPLDAAFSHTLELTAAPSLGEERAS